ncbi:MAG: NapC/NirT family cytochrome c [Candidatus Acidiferrales bacterium]|jgi:nitrate/TMAO reductase-like tetraheme cytochrome c subunit
MSLLERIGPWFRPAAYLGRNRLTLAGAVLTTSSAVTLISFWLLDIVVGGTINPYIGLIFLLILPGIFVIGLLLMPIGVLWRRMGLVKAGKLPAIYPRVDLSMSAVRHAVFWVGGLTLANVIIFSVASYRGVEYMDSAKFCGQTCHTVMQPEFTAYENSSHQRVACVECHIGPGASWFVRSKLSGLRQVYAVTFHTYEHPIPTPVAQLRPSRETCEQCHWPQVFTGNKLVVIRKFNEDEQNTEVTTVLLLKIGGRTWNGAVGIHGAHLDTKAPIEYISTDRQRQTIAQVSYTDIAGQRTVFTATDTNPTAAQLAAGEHRTMDCIDCHNRPTHTFQLPESAINQVMAQGGISPDLPYIRKEAVQVLKVNYPDRETAARQIAAALDNFYQAYYPDVYRDKRALLDTAIGQVQAAYDRNVFPAMNVTWGTYPNNLGHMDFPGCFRCHDGSHTSADGKTIPNDCDTCHTILAVEEPNPKVLADLGVN